MAITENDINVNVEAPKSQAGQTESVYIPVSTNAIKGILQGTYGDDTNFYDISVNIIEGKIAGIYFKHNGQWLNITDMYIEYYIKYILFTQGQITDTLSIYRQNDDSPSIEIPISKVRTVAGKIGDVVLNKADVGLGNVDNTSDANKPISNAAQAAFDAITGKIPAEASSTNKLADKQWVLENGGKVDDIRVNGVSKVVNKIVNLIVKDTLADDSNDLATISAIRAFVNSSIEASVADYLRTSNGDAFATRAALLQGPWYYGSTTKTPTRNDYAVVIADETHGGMSARYIYQNGWAFQYTFNMQFTQAQLNAMNSGITAAKLALIDADISNRVEKTNQSKKFYGTDANGNQTLYDLAESGVVLASNFIQILAKGEQPTEELQDGGIVFENIFEEV